MSEEDIRNYKKYISEIGITKYIILDKDENYWYSAEYVDKMLKKQDKEIERLENIIKEVREYIEKNIVDYITNYDDLRENLLGILDKEW